MAGYSDLIRDPFSQSEGRLRKEGEIDTEGGKSVKAKDLTGKWRKMSSFRRRKVK